MEKENVSPDIYIEIKKQIQQNRDRLTELGRELFLNPEPGFKEVKSNQILTSFLYNRKVLHFTDF